MQLISTFVSYLILMLCFVAVAGSAVALGIYLRRKKDSGAPEA